MLLVDCAVDDFADDIAMQMHEYVASCRCRSRAAADGREDVDIADV
jgi:hypothetical protein